MYTERFSFGFVSRVVIDAAERLRPGLGPWSAEVSDKLREVFVRELAEIKPRFLELFSDEVYWKRLEHTMLNECFPRYCAIARKETAAAGRGYGIWRNGDLIARGAYGLGGLAIGAALVYLPFIPIPRTWDFLILATMFGAPFLPELQVSLHQRAFRKAQDSIVADMQRAELVDQLYESFESPPVAGESAPVSEQSSSGANPVRTREG